MRKLFLSFAAAATLSAGAAQPGGQPSGQYFKLFAPLTFYHSVANSQLSITSSDQDEVNAAINEALTHVYLNRPDLVEVSEREMQKSGALRQDIIESPVQQTLEITQQAEPVEDEPEAEPVEVVIEKPNFWKYKGDGYLQFMQNYVSGNWYKGGESNYSAVGSLTLEANYDNQQKFKWENKLEMKLGMQTSRSDEVHKYKTNEDLLRYTGKVGLQAAKHWYYTLQLLAYTQFTHSYKANDRKVYADFMSPFNASVGLGMDYKVEWLDKKLTGTVNMSPIAVNYVYVGRTWFDRPDMDNPDSWQWFPSRYGIDAHDHGLFKFASNMTASLEWKINDVLTWKTRLFASTSYDRGLIEWENTFSLRVSKYISANLFVFPRFDDTNKRDEDLGYWQFKEFSSLGFSYSF